MHESGERRVACRRLPDRGRLWHAAAMLAPVAMRQFVDLDQRLGRLEAR